MIKSLHLNKKAILRVRNVRQWILISIAMLTATLISLPRIVTIYRKSANLLKESFTDATVDDVIIRGLLLTLYSWFILQFNTNWKNLYASIKPFYRHLVTLLINTVAVFVFVNLLFIVYPLFEDEIITKGEIAITYFTYSIVFALLFFISRVLRYQLIYQRQVEVNQQLKQQSLRNELSALKNQVNPHFLFNSLNSLNSLIRGNIEATTFVNKLSYMYRYILQSTNSDLVSIAEELKFLESYLFLIKTRYRDRFFVELTIANEYLEREVPPLALQLLVENAVKHNEISESNPLEVKIYSNDDYICVENKIRKRVNLNSTGSGLSNLDQRFFLLKNEHILISNSDGIFKVKLSVRN